MSERAFLLERLSSILYMQCIKNCLVHQSLFLPLRRGLCNISSWSLSLPARNRSTNHLGWLERIGRGAAGCLGIYILSLWVVDGVGLHGEHSQLVYFFGHAS